ncbi:nitroreductase family protein [Ectobacillus ponti]|uniref:Nitroreductase family protein n=1 Tax=Ectobacillus ponti TaxID=2961894 RepID=A0AA42BQ65_9BACI|nr:nitroreductase family protein [Ectobacillus ponti]MCP8969985.1 nitroreductase family protein [Ectobacillus ponti]
MHTQTLQKPLTVKEAIESRHSIRQYVQEPMPKEDLEEILRLTSLAPSAWNLQTWRIHAVTDPGLKEQLQEAAYGQKQVTLAPVVIVLASDMEDVLQNLEETLHPGLSPERKQSEAANLSAIFGGMSVEERGQWGLTQANIALGFMMLAARGLGYGSVPMLGFDQQKVRELLGLPEHAKFAAMLPIGRADQEGYPHHRHSLDRIVTYH